MRIAILGTRGIPNHHGGFEQFAEYFSVFLAQKGHEVYVYNSHNHPYGRNEYKNVNILHCYDPEASIGTAGQFIYDLNCIVDSRKRNFDIILQLGYTSSSLWYKVLPKKPIVITNMDGLEWKRSKYSKKVQIYLKSAEKWAVKSSDFLISDSVGIQDYLKKKYYVDSKYIAYGANVFTFPDKEVLKNYYVESYGYNMLIARLEPENNIVTILDGVASAKLNLPFLVIGKHETKFGEYLKDRYKIEKRIRFLGGIYNQEHLNNLRYFSNFYFHGHSVGGTNPSLLEAMATGALIVAHKNIFNASILKDNSFYFENKDEVAEILDNFRKSDFLDMVEKNSREIEEHYNWDKINCEYLDYFKECFSE